MIDYTRHAIATRGQNAALVTAEHWADGVAVITAIERLPFDVEAIVARVRLLQAAEPDAQGVVDGDGLGDAVIELLQLPKRGAWRAYTARKADRAELTRTLLVGVAARSFSFVGGLAEQERMRKALSTLTRDIREDGPGSELAVALSLALDDHRPPPQPPLFVGSTASIQSPAPAGHLPPGLREL